ncbi:hypothetical protein L6164_026685 [Bauhinia variegata]|uniref:Uncharacterized protein n=1 Tax=Bauhinia variegata TaxID=167791 RepID=A0ACB9LSG8_BAUVA|nr:hypothetical protein L6164_026685 [Bauhinia variegata]
MAVTLLWNLQNLWPFSLFKYDDLRLSKQLVSKLSIPEHTKQFVFAIRDPENQSVIYILSAVSLSQRSVFDAECLIKEIRPDAVVVQADHSPFEEIQSEESELEDRHDAPLPTSSFGVIKQCFFDKIGKEKYENVAGNFVLREIFGTSFHGHLWAAMKAAEEVGSSFVVLESPSGKSSCGNSSVDGNPGNKFQSLVSSLVPQKGGSLSPATLKRFPLSNDVKSQMAKALSLHMDYQSSLVSKEGSKEIRPRSNYETPAFARSIYPLLEDLHNIFVDLTSIGKSLAQVQKLLLDVNRGEVLDSKIVSEVYTFRVAVEGLRIALHNNGLQPINRKDISNSAKIEFSELPVEDKSHVIFAQALRSQTDKFKTIVAVVDAGDIAGIRQHWHTALPAEIKESVGEVIANPEVEGIISNQKDGKRSLTEKPIVAVGAGATAALGASSLTKVIPASTVMKILTFKVPATLKLFLSQTQKALAFALGPSKAVAPGIASSGAKTSGFFKAAVSAEKIRGVTHSVIASAEKTSISAMRTAFYEIMRKRKVQPVGFFPWATFACSFFSCTGLLLYADGIECAVESIPAAPSIASLGRGIQNLRETSQLVMQTEGTRIQKSIESLIDSLKKAKSH